MPALTIRSEPHRPVIVDSENGKVELRFGEPGTPATKWVELTPTEATWVARMLMGEVAKIDVKSAL